MKQTLTIFISKLFFLIIKILNLGGGSTWPGHLALFFDKDFIKKIVFKNPHLKIILITGTNGKTTSTSFLKYLIRKIDYKVFSNEEGANLLNGICSSLIKNSNLLGKINYDFAIFEVDEFSFPLVAKNINPYAVVILNLFRDQLDRYGEVNTIGLHWFETLKKLKKSILVINADDPYLYYSAKNLPQEKLYFGVKQSLMKIKDLPHDVDFNYCPVCQSILKYKKISYAHLGEYFCSKCGFIKNNNEIQTFKNKKISYPLSGLYNIYNTNAILTLFNYLFKEKFKEINSLISDFKPSFGRQELIFYQKRKVFIILSKNPAGFNQSIKTVNNLIKDKKANFLILLNDRIPDGQDVSWIWDVDFASLFDKAKKIFVSGDRVYDMTLRLKYEKGGIFEKNLIPIENLSQSIDTAIKETPIDDTLYLLTTYSAMLEARKILVGKKFL